VNGIEYIARPPRLRKLKDWAIFKRQCITRGAALDVQPAHSQILSQKAGTYLKTLGPKYIQQFRVLDGHRTVRTAVFLMIVTVANEALGVNEGVWYWQLGNSASRHAHLFYVAGSRLLRCIDHGLTSRGSFVGCL
jgi:hypothetical protein